jgi:penicillin-binding protein 2
MTLVRDTDRGRLLTRRAFLVGGAQVALFGVLGNRLYDLQIKEGERYVTLAEANRISMRVVLPPRGIITDRSGALLARSDKSFRAVLVPEQTADVQQTLRRLYELLPFEDWEKKRIEKDLKKKRAFVPLLLRENIDWDTLSLLELNTPDLPGLAIEAGETRFYPFKDATAHILGYVGAPTEEEAKKDPLLSQPSFRLGKGGVERVYDLDLRGEAGTSQVEVNAYGRPVRELSRHDGQTGHELRLTLDMSLQQYAQKRLTAEASASAVIMDALDGSIYSLASHPSFDPNQFVYGISKDAWNKLNTDQMVPLINKAVMGLYAPGSTFKVVVAMAALEQGISPKNSHVCPGYLNFGNHRFHCWKKGGHGTVDMKRGLSQSCDVFFYQVSQKVGIDAIHEMAKRLGLSEKLGVDLPNEKAGLVPNRAWKAKNFKEGWQQGETLVASIGQGYMLATPLQLAVMTARIAGGGFAVKPHVMQSIKDLKRAEETFPSLGLKPENIKFIQDAMIAVCRAGGTAVKAQIPYAGYEMGGKTGTSQVRRISKAERAKGVIPNEKRPWEDRDHALFISFAPVQNPRYVCAVVVEHGGGGSKNAAPIARDLLMQVMKLDPAKALDRPLAASDHDDKKSGDEKPSDTVQDKSQVKDNIPDAAPDSQLDDDEELMLDDEDLLDDPH